MPTPEISQPIRTVPGDGHSDMFCCELNTAPPIIDPTMSAVKRHQSEIAGGPGGSPWGSINVCGACLDRSSAMKTEVSSLRFLIAQLAFAEVDLGQAVHRALAR
jgi:hypothetical protein